MAKPVTNDAEQLPPTLRAAFSVLNKYGAFAVVAGVLLWFFLFKMWDAQQALQATANTLTVMVAEHIKQNEREQSSLQNAVNSLIRINQVTCWNMAKTDNQRQECIK